MANSHTKQERFPSYGTAQTRQKVLARAVTVPSAAIQNKTPCVKPQTEGESALCAQWRSALAAEKSAEWAIWSTILSGVGISFLLWQIMLTRAAVTDTGKSTKAMIAANEIAATSARAWISVRIVSLTYFEQREREDTGITYRYILLVEIKNHGPSPASYVNFSANILLPGADADIIRYCDDLRGTFSHPNARGISLFSGQQEVISQLVAINESQIKSAQEGTGKTWISPRLVGCVSYRTPHANGVRQTRLFSSLTDQGFMIDTAYPPWFRSLKPELNLVETD